MTDAFTTSKRSDVMSRIRSCGNRETELRMAALLRDHKLTGWRRAARMQGKPDFVWRRERLALFVDGCFWHGCPRCYRRPSSNCKYWDAKIAGNRNRDRAVTQALRRAGWRVVRIWDHNFRNPRSVVLRVRRSLATVQQPARLRNNAA